MPDQMTTPRLLPAARIEPRPNVKPLNAEKVAEIADSIRDNGLLAAIIVAAVVVVSGEYDRRHAWMIVAGHYRYAAMVQLGWSMLPCIEIKGSPQQLELVSIDENLARKNLSRAELVQHICRRKQIYEQLHPETAHGGDRASRQIGELTTIRFTQEAARLTGRSERTMQRAASLGDVLRYDLDRIAGTSLDKPGKLEALAKMTAKARDPIIKQAIIKQAISSKQVSVRGQAKVLTDAESEAKWLARGQRWWNEGSEKRRNAFLAWMSTA